MTKHRRHRTMFRRRVKPPAYIPERGPTTDSPFGCPPTVSGYPLPPEELAAIQSMLAGHGRTQQSRQTTDD